MHHWVTAVEVPILKLEFEARGCGWCESQTQPDSGHPSHLPSPHPPAKLSRWLATSLCAQLSHPSLHSWASRGATPCHSELPGSRARCAQHSSVILTHYNFKLKNRQPRASTKINTKSGYCDCARRNVLQELSAPSNSIAQHTVNPVDKYRSSHCQFPPWTL